MKKRIWKKLVALGLALTLFFSYGNITTLAASSVSGNMSGAAIRGTINIYDDSSATAVTTFERPSSQIYATAYVYYWWGTYYYYNSSGRRYATAGGISVTATKKLGGADVVGAEGIHEVKYGAYSWGPVQTTTGTIPSRAIEI